MARKKINKRLKPAKLSQRAQSRVLATSQVALAERVILNQWALIALAALDIIAHTIHFFR